MTTTFKLLFSKMSDTILKVEGRTAAPPAEWVAIDIPAGTPITLHGQPVANPMTIVQWERDSGSPGCTVETDEDGAVIKADFTSVP
jgi:hypothetical protein